jgi:hypothetical protein
MKELGVHNSYSEFSNVIKKEVLADSKTLEKGKTRLLTLLLAEAKPIAQVVPYEPLADSGWNVKSRTLMRLLKN